jgi:hypothetical protein
MSLARSDNWGCREKGGCTLSRPFGKGGCPLFRSAAREKGTAPFSQNREKGTVPFFLTCGAEDEA